MDADQISEIAQQLFDEYRAKAQFKPLSGSNKPQTLQQAYQIQSAVYDLMGSSGGLGMRGGHKIALPSAAIQSLVGLDSPIYGAIFASQIYDSGRTLSLNEYGRLGLEFEVGVRFAADVPPSSTPYTKESIAPFVHACAPVFELIEDRAADYSKLDAYSVLADRCWCDGAVLGQWVTDWDTLDLSSCSVQMICNDEVVDQAKTGDAMGHPFTGLAWVANYLNETGSGLKKDEIVITGSALKTYFGEPGDQITYQIAGLGDSPGVSKLSPLKNQPPLVLGQNNCGLCCPSHDRFKNAGVALISGADPLLLPVSLPGLVLSSPPPQAARTTDVPITASAALNECNEEAMLFVPCVLCVSMK